MFNFASIIKVLIILSYSSSIALSGEINIFISSDWEGMHLDKYNISKMNQFNKKYPEIGITHFLNAAYYTKKNLSSQKINSLISRTIKKNDGLGLHIHGWKSLFENSKVAYKSSPSWEPDYICDLKRQIDCGHDIPISVYKTSDLQKVIRESLSILKENGFYPLTSFRAGGWMASANVIDAIAKEGILVDSSAVDAKLLHKKLPRGRNFKFLEMLLPIWPNTNWKSQPYILKTKNQKVIEYPNNGLYADYLSTNEMYQIYLGHTQMLKKNPNKTYTISYGFHQETADRYLIRIENLIDKIKEHAKKNKIIINFKTL